MEDLKEHGGDDVVRPSSTLQKIQAKKFLKKISSLQHRSVCGIGGEQSFRRGGGGIKNGYLPTNFILEDLTMMLGVESWS